MSRDVKILRKAIAQIDDLIGEQEAQVKALENEAVAVLEELHQVDADQQRKAEECRRRCEHRAAERAGEQREKLLYEQGKIKGSKRRINERVLNKLRKRRQGLVHEVEETIERQHLGASGGGRRRSTRRKRRRSTRRKRRRRSTRRKRRRRKRRS